jgi:hypothetical protein
MVCYISDRAGVIDARASKLHRQLRNQFRYESLRMLHAERLALDLGAVGTVKRPNGPWIRVRPLHVGGRAMLISVEAEGALKTDLLVRNGQLVVIGAEPYRDGKLIISLEPQF